MSIISDGHSLLHCNMASLVPNPTSILLTEAVAFKSKKSNILSRRRILRNVNKHTLPFSTSVRLFPQFHIGHVLKPKQRTLTASASGTDVAVEEADLSSADSGASLSAPESSGELPSVPDTSSVKRSRPARKSDMPPVKNEQLIAGATFTGKVRSIQPFGAFVDFGAFTDGLVHVSQLSDSYVKDVANVVTVGQEVKVRIIEANMETGRISLSTRSGDDTSKAQQQRDSPGSNDKSRPPRRTGQKSNETKKFSKFVKGQDLEGIVKNLGRAGSFISLPEGEEGFLPTSEESDEGFNNMMGISSLEVGQEVSVRVLRISRGQVTLTMKKAEAGGELDAKLSQGTVHTATNPFVLAFLSNQDIAAFLVEREKEKQEAEATEEIPKEMDDKAVSTTDDTSSVALEKEDNAEKTPDDSETKGDEVEVIEEVQAGSVLVGDDGSSKDTDDTSSIALEKEDEVEKAPEVPETKDDEVKVIEEVEASSVSVGDDGNQPTEDQVAEESSLTEARDSNDEVSGEVADISSQIVEEVKENVVDDATIEDELPGDSLSIDATGEETEQEVSGEITNENSPDLADVDEEKSEETDSSSVAQDNEVSAVTAPSESDSSNSSSAEFEAEVVEAKSSESPVSENVVDNGNASNSNGESSNSLSQETAVKAAISPALVKQLREETGAGMMECKRALSETGGDIEKAYEYLRKKGLASADKKASRATAEGRIGSYIHDSRIGVLIEVNCETDFVARGDIFKGLVEDLAMQVAACPQVQYLNPEDFPQEFVEKEKEIEMQKEDLLLRPEQIRSKIVDGRIRKRLEDLSLLEQPFIKDDKVVVKDWVKQTIATIGENIKVKRFVRYNLGEGLEKKSQDFAAEVAAQTAAKPVSTPGENQEPAVAETKDTVNEPPKAVISAALVKQLREETGAGMMDCKKALSETGGDLEKAHEYLRKKGLAAADKKSSRLAAEGRIGSYIHDSRIGVLIEVNCETDFVGRSENFKQLVDDLAMQVVACPQVQSVSIEQVPESVITKEKELEMQREDLQLKPESIRETIVEGRVTKRLGELALLEQPYIKDDSILVKDLVKQTVAALGENIKVRRFVRFTLGETIDAKVEDQA